MRKKAIFLLACVAIAASLQSVYAGDVKMKASSTYYGTKASTNPNNPCKGATTRKCGVIETSYTMIGQNLSGSIYQTDKVTMDADGVVIGTSSDQILVPINFSLQEYVNTNWGNIQNATFPEWDLKKYPVEIGGNVNP